MIEYIEIILILVLIILVGLVLLNLKKKNESDGDVYSKSDHEGFRDKIIEDINRRVLGPLKVYLRQNQIKF